MVTQTTQYSLRAGAPQPISECQLQSNQTNLQIQRTKGFVLQTFKAEKIVTESCEDKEELLCSSDMVGLGGNYLNANYTAQRFLNPDNGAIVFVSKETLDFEVIEEDEVPGAGNL